LTIPISNFCGLAPSIYRSMLMGEVNDLIDEDERPIGEIRSNASVRANVITEYRACRYSGSRGQSGLLINFSALKQAIRSWPRVLGTVEYVRTAYLDRYPTDELSLLELARVSGVGLLLPAYIIFREPSRVTAGQVPVFVSVTHKLLAGVFSLTKNLLLCQVAMGNPYDKVLADANTLYDFAELSGMLVGKTGTEVCAGTPGMIDEILSILVRGESKEKPECSQVLPPRIET
jgi:hypothetical protein